MKLEEKGLRVGEKQLKSPDHPGRNGSRDQSWKTGRERGKRRCGWYHFSSADRVSGARFLTQMQERQNLRAIWKRDGESKGNLAGWDYWI